MNLFEMTDVGVRLGGSPVLGGVTLSMEPGEIVTIIGPNGAGKSTLLRVLVGALGPTEGRVTRKPGLRIGYVPQRLLLDATLPMTVARMMRLGRLARAVDVAQALELAGLPSIGSRQMSDLSGGQLQRVMLARALLGRPDILILDEATAGLDHPGTAAFYRQIEQVRRDTGCAVLMVSHDLHVVMSASDRVVCLNGHICCQGAPSHVATAPQYRALFGEGAQGALALYAHHHDHDPGYDDDHGHGPVREAAE